MPRILITGGSGLLALNWGLALRDCCEIILGIHNRNVNLDGTSSRSVNLESVDSFARSLDEVMPQVVVHTVALTNVEECESNPALASHVNVMLAANVARSCASRGVKLVYVSTDHIFSGERSFVTEGQSISPKNVYGRTKAEAEYRVLEVNPKALVVRTNFYGWGTSYRRSFSDVVLDALRERKTITLFKDVFFSPILAETLARAVQELIFRNACGIYNVVGDDRISKYEFGLKIAERFCLDPNGIKCGLLSDRIDLVARPFDMSLSNQKVTEFLSRKLGGVGQDLNRLAQQQKEGIAQLIQNI